MRVFVEDDIAHVHVNSRVGVISVFVRACYSDRSCVRLIQSSKDVEIRQAIVDIIEPVGLYWSVFWNYILEISLSQLITRLYYQLKNISVALYEITSVP